MIIIKSKNIKYVGFYGLPNSKNKRQFGLSAKNKMDYVVSALKKAKYEVEIVSPSWIKNNPKTSNNSNLKFKKQKKIRLDKATSLTLSPSLITKNVTMGRRRIKQTISLFWLFFYLVKNVKRNEKVLVYHEPSLSIPIRAAKFFKRFNLVLEVEEVYGDVFGMSKFGVWKEKKLINIADSFIFVSDNLKQILNNNDEKEDVILYGSYHTIENRNEKYRADDNIQKLVYAGTLDTVTGGAYKAVETMNYLPDNYRLHILGYGNNDQIQNLENMIEEINYKRGKQICNYEGTLHGEDYSNFLLNCDIALNPQKPGDYMETAFPSKIISYLSHNLRVVSTKIKSIEKSPVSKNIYFSKDDSSESISEAIMSINMGKSYNSKKIINKLDKSFIENLKLLLESK